MEDGACATTAVARRYMLAERTIDDDDLQDLVAWLGGDPWLTQGRLVREFETAWSRWLGVRHSVFVNSGSSANLLMYYALLVSGRLRNHSVVVPAVSWATTVAPAIQLGFEPLMCEADQETFGLEVNHLEQLLRRHEPAAVIAVHVLGVPVDMESLIWLRDRYGFFLMEDACAAVGSRYDGRLVGTLGDLSSFSFYYGHHISTIEGGMVCTDDRSLYEILLHLRSHGWAKDLSPEREAEQARRRGVMEFNRPFTFYYPGFNVRSTDLNARLGLSQLRKLESIVERRVENHRVYQSRFAVARDFRCQRNPRATISSISFCALAPSREHRDRIARAMREHGIETRPIGGGNMSRQPFWSDRYGETVFPFADRVHATGFQMPNHHLLTPEDIHHICDVVLSTP